MRAKSPRDKCKFVKSLDQGTVTKFVLDISLTTD